MKKTLNNMDSKLYGIKELITESIECLDDWIGIYADIKWTLHNENLTAEEKLKNIKEICGVDDD